MNKIYYRESGAGFSTEGMTFIPEETHFLVARSEKNEDEIFHDYNMNITDIFAELIMNNPYVGHTSMSVGDVVVKADGTVLVCANCGWDELKEKDGVWS